MRKAKINTDYTPEEDFNELYEEFLVKELKKKVTGYAEIETSTKIVQLNDGGEEMGLRAFRDAVKDCENKALQLACDNYGGEF
jgi:hypothetical protein